MNGGWRALGRGCLLTLLTGSVAAGPAELALPVCERAPTLDADLGDPAWRRAAKVTGFTLLPTGRAADVQTTAWLCRDDAYLYLAFRCDEPLAPAGAVKAIETVRDGNVSKDDAVEVFLDPGSGGLAYFHFLLSAGNVQADQRCSAGPDRGRDTRWSLPWRSAARVDAPLTRARGWSAELAIPLAPLQGRVRATNAWTINLCRSRQACTPAEYSSLAPLPKGAGFHTPAAFIPLEGLNGFQARPVFAPLLEHVAVLPLEVQEGGFGYGLRVTVNNQSGLPGAVELVAEDMPRGGPPRGVSTSLDLNPIDTRTVDLRLPMADVGPRSARVGLRLPGAADWLQSTAVPDMDRISPFDAYLDRNYYTTEREAAVWVELGSESMARPESGFALRAELAAGDGRPLSRAETGCTQSMIRLPLSLAAVPDGKFSVSVSLLTGAARPMGHMDLTSRKVPPAPAGVNEVKIDHYHRCFLVNNEPFFMIGAYGLIGKPWDNLAATERQYRHCQRAGFNMLIDWKGYDAKNRPVPAVAAEYDLALKYGMKVMGLIASHCLDVPPGDLSYRDANKSPRFRAATAKMLNELDAYLAYGRTSAAVIAYYHFDEPQRDLGIDDILTAYKDKVHRLDPYHPVHLSCHALHTPEWVGTVTDTLGIHRYWYVMKPSTLNRSAEDFEELDRLSKRAHVPTMAFSRIDFWGHSYGNNGFMTPHEQRAQVYFGLIHGTRALVYFALPWHHQASVEAQGQLSAEIRAMAPALLNREPRQTVTFEPAASIIRGKKPGYDFPIVQTALRQYPDGAHLLLAINGSHRVPVQAAFTVSSLAGAGRVERLFSQEPPPAVKDGAFTETLEPWGTRVYRWQPAGPSAMPVTIHLAMRTPDGGLALDEEAAPPEPLGENLLANPGFEADDGWGPFERSADQPHGGARALVLSRAEPSDRTTDVLSEPIRLKPDTRYRLGGWIRPALSAGKRLPCLMAYSAAPTDGTYRLAASAYAAQWAPVWQEVEKTFTMPPEPPESVRLYLRLPAGAVGLACFDDLTLREVLAAAEPVPPSVNLVKNSSFEDARMPGYPDWWSCDPLMVYEHLVPSPLASGIETNRPYHGRACFRLARAAPGTSCGLLANPIPLTAGREYTLSAYLRTDPGGTRISAGLYVGTTHVYVPLGPEWTRGQITVRAAGSTPAMPGVYASQGGNVYVDAVQFERNTNATDYAP